MKGFGSSILAVVFLVAITISAFYSYGLAVGVNDGVVKKISIEKDVYLLGNAVDYGKLYLDTALKYSVYQALYDYSLEQKEDFSDPIETESGAPYGSGSLLSYTTLDTPTQFKSVLSEKVKENINKYTENPITYFSSNYNVRLPKYDNIVVQGSPISIEAKTNGKVEIDETSVDEKIVIKKSADLNFSIDYRLFDEASEFVSSGNIESSVSDILNSFDIIGKKGGECNISSIEVFNTAHNSSFSDFDQADFEVSSMVFSEIINKVNKINSTNLWSVSPFGNVTIKSSCVDSCGSQKSTSCTFDYLYDFEFIFLIESKDKFPVVSGALVKKSNFEPLSLGFTQRMTNIE